MRLLRESDVGLPSPITGDIALDAFHQISRSALLFVEQGWSAEEVFWSRYFWFTVFAILSARSNGDDAGIEQQQFQILESPFPLCSPDWSQLEVIHALVESELLRLS